MASLLLGDSGVGTGIRVDLHVHSVNSDGTNPVSEIIQYAINNTGLSGIAFSEHTFSDCLSPLRSYEEAQTYLVQQGLDRTIVIYPAAELSLLIPGNKRNKVHGLILGDIGELEKMLRGVAHFGSVVPVEATKEYNLKMFLAHPKPHDLFYDAGVITHFHGVEYTPNLLTNPISNNSRYCLSKLLMQSVPVIATSDAHHLSSLGVHTEFSELTPSVFDLITINNISALCVEEVRSKNIKRLCRSLNGLISIKFLDQLPKS